MQVEVPKTSSGKAFNEVVQRAQAVCASGWFNGLITLTIVVVAVTIGKRETCNARPRYWMCVL